MDVSNRINQQLQPIERVPDANQRCGCLIGEQSERRCAPAEPSATVRLERMPDTRWMDRPSKLSARGIFASTASASRRPWSVGSSSRLKNSHPPPEEPPEQAIHRRPQYRRASAQLGVLSERFVDDRIERDDPPDQVEPNRTNCRFIRPRRRERAGEASGDFSRDRRELDSQPPPPRRQNRSRRPRKCRCQSRWRGSPRSMPTSRWSSHRMRHGATHRLLAKAVSLSSNAPNSRHFVSHLKIPAMSAV